MARVITSTDHPGTNRLLMLASVFCAGMAALFVFAVLNQHGSSSGPAAVATQDVVVAARDIAANTTVTADMLEIHAVPNAQVLDGAFTNNAAA